MHSVTDRRTDRQTDRQMDTIIMPLLTACTAQYNRLKYY